LQLFLLPLLLPLTRRRAPQQQAVVGAVFALSAFPVWLFEGEGE
jgi:hypothetical protein